MSGCISLAYRAVTQKNLEFFLQNRKKFFSIHDTKFGVNPDPKFSYTGDEHYRWYYGGRLFGRKAFGQKAFGQKIPKWGIRSKRR